MMTKITCTRKVHFCSGHRVFKHEGKCANPHGHNYYAHIVAEVDCLDDVGRVIDFSVLKEKIGSWIDLNWDHTFLLFEEDVEMIRALRSISTPKPLFICPFNPTAENMADYLLNVVCPRELKGSNILIKKIVIHETDNCYAEASLN
ncbi:MAG: 6-pyruvoyl trahydropterin synthase family protein [Parachlamydiaceae bacterium]